jgi:Asp/Glu/hydantoin racemase
MNGRMSQVVLVNPNTDIKVTARMLANARARSGHRLNIEGLTAEYGDALLINEAALVIATRAVTALAPKLRDTADAVIVAAFGDPGVDDLRVLLDVPVVGIGEAALKKAASGGKRFGVITTTPDLVAAIDARVGTLGLAEHYGGVILTRGDAVTVTNSPALLAEELLQAARRAADLGMSAVAVGGGPLADAGRAIASRTTIELVDPIEAALDRVLLELDATHRD